MQWWGCCGEGTNTAVAVLATDIKASPKAAEHGHAAVV